MRKVSEFTQGLRHYSLASGLLSSSNYSFKSLENHLLKAYQNNFHSVNLSLIMFYRNHNMYRETIYWFKKHPYHLDHELVLDIAMWFEKGLGTEINYDEAAKMYISIAHSNNTALKRLLTLYRDNKTKYYGTIHKYNNLAYWDNQLKIRLRREYQALNVKKKRLINYSFINSIHCSL